MNEQTNEIPGLGDEHDLEEFQVVRREFFAHTTEPAVTFHNCRFYVNAACLSKFPDTDYVQVLINRQSQILALRPCLEGERDHFAWCGLLKGRRKPKQLTCKLFFAQVAAMMGWDPSHHYKIFGWCARANGERLLVFDLTAAEVYFSGKCKTSRVPIFPENWRDQFGLPFQEHRQSMRADIFDGYAIYSIKDSHTPKDDYTEQENECHEE